MNYIYGFAIDDDVAHTTGSMVRSRPRRPLGARDLPAETAASKDHFRAGAAGDLHGDDDGLDVWTVDDSGTIENLRDDCRWTKFHAFSGG
jgi:hypothetical protein